MVKKILLVADEKDIVEVITSRLKASNYNVINCNEILKERRHACVI